MNETLQEITEAAEPVKIPKKQPVVEVEIIKTKGKTSLVTYLVDDFRYRVYIPTAKIDNGKVEERILTKGVPYGLPWELIALPEITGEDFAKVLHNHNIWTAEECRANPQGKRAAIMQLYQPLHAALNAFLHEQPKGGK